jgi:hypothetical protein
VPINIVVAQTVAWDRQPVVYDEAGSEGKVQALNPQTHQIRRNFIFNRNWLGSTNSGYCAS